MDSIDRSGYQDQMDEYTASLKNSTFFNSPRPQGLLSNFNVNNSTRMSQSVAYGQPQKTNDTIAGQIQETVGKPIAAGIETAQGIPVIGWLTNSALNVAQAIGQYIIDPAMRGIATVALADDAMAKGKGLDYAWQQAENMSPGQAIAGQFMLPNGDIFDEEKRKELFENSWVGVLSSGAIDLGINILGSKGTGAFVQGGKTVVLGSNRVRDLSSLRVTADAAVAWGEAGLGGAAPTAFAKFVDDAVNVSDAGVMKLNPFVQNSAHPDRLATLLAGTNTHRGVTEIILAERGDKLALDRLRDELPLAHDALTDFNFDMTKPLPSFNDVHKLPEGPEVDQYNKVIAALAEKDPQFAKQLDAFVSDTAGDRFLTNWKPGRFAAVEKARLIPKNAKMAALMGDWGYITGGTGWKVSERQGDRYTRGVRFFQWAAGSRPQGHINVSNPRMNESVEDIVSEMNRMTFLRDNVDFKESQVRLYTEATNDIERAKVLGRIEQNILYKMAEHYNIGNIRAVAVREGRDSKPDYLRAVWTELNQRRDTTKGFLEKNGFVPDENGTINFIGGTKYPQNLVAISTEPQSVPMMDFRRLEAELIHQLDRLNHSDTGRIGGKFELSKRKVASAKLNRSQVVMGLTQFGDLAQMAFSNLHLLRLAFIPKNSMIDPVMRSSMALDRLLGTGGGTAARIAKTMHNNTVRRATTLPAASFKARWGSEVRNLRKDLDDIKTDFGDTEIEFLASKKAVEKSQAKVDKLNEELKAVKGKNGDAVAERQRINDLIVDESARLKSLKTDNDVLQSAYDNFAQARLANLTQQAGILARVGDEKAALEYVGKESFVITKRDGTTVEVSGSLDPQSRGASAYRAETDSWMNFYSTQRQSEVLSRMREETGWQEIVPDSSNKEVMADYYEAVSHIANRNVRQELDLVLGRLMRGESTDSIVTWMKSTPEGREYMRRIAPRVSNNSGTTVLDEDLNGWLEYTRQNVEDIFPSEELRKIVLERNVTPDEVKAFLQGYEGSLKTIYGPTSRSAFKSATLGQKAMLASDALSRKGWKIISGVEDKMARMPLFNEYWKQEMKQIADYLDSQGVDITYDMLNNSVRQQAYRRALSRVEETLYSSRRLTNGGYAMRYMMAFPAAFFNSQKVALKAMARNPYNAYWYNSVMQAMDSPFFGSFYEDKDGNMYEKMADVPKGVDVSMRITMPLMPTIAGNINKKMKELGFSAYLDPQLGGMKINQKQLQFMLGDPGLSWMGGAALSEIIKKADLDVPMVGKVTGIDIIQGLKKTFGEDFYNQSIMFNGQLVEGKNLVETFGNQMIPVTYKQFFAATFGGQGNEMLMDETNRLYRIQYRDWITAGSPDGSKPNYEQCLQTARNVMTIRGIISFSAPLSTTFDPASREATTNYSKLMDKHGNDYEKATDEYVNIYGWESLALLGSSSQRPLGQGATLTDQKILQEHPDLIKDIISTTGDAKSARVLFWTNNADVKGEYDNGIAGIQASMSIPGSGGAPLVEAKTSKEIQDDIEQRVGWYEYSKLDQWRQSMMEQFGVKSTASEMYARTGIRDKFLEGENGLRKKYPAWDADREFNRQGWYTNTGAALEKIVANREWMQAQTGTLWSEVKQFLDASNQVRTAYDNAQYGEEMTFVKGQLEEVYYYMLNNFSSEFGDFASRYLSSHPLLNIEE